MRGSRDHLTNAPITSRGLKLQAASPWSSEDLLRGNINPIVYPLARGRVLQLYAVECSLAHHHVGSSAGFAEEVLRRSSLWRHPHENNFSWHQLTEVLGLIDRPFLSG